VLAELMPPLDKDGKSVLWEALGRRFTGLTYQEADRLSRANKEFIKELFPQSDLYVTLMSERAQRVVGEVGPETKGVQRMLERIGFKYVERIDPFDGGPHYEAHLSDVTLVRRFRTAKLGPTPFEDEGEEMLVSWEKESGRARFRAVRCAVRFSDQVAHIPARAREALGAPVGAKLALIPFE
jgi:arginine N-succinyltransferase